MGWSALKYDGSNKYKLFEIFQPLVDSAQEDIKKHHPDAEVYQILMDFEDKVILFKVRSKDFDGKDRGYLSELKEM